MIRKLAFALSLLGMGFAGLVHALGLGEVNIKSSLNQPLNAEIELVSVKELGQAEILPGLATREEFIKAGVDRVYFLSDIRFKVEPNEKGDLVVVLTTNKPVREPFLNFLVEVIWPSGRLLREYSLLIDPPIFAEKAPAPVVAAPVIRRTALGDTLAVPSSQPAPVKQTISTGSRSGAVPESYGKTTSRDTLWEIALKARPDRSVSPQQVMLAIQDLNPNAFIDNNINKLKEGQVLRLPTLEQMKARSSAQAINQVIAQNSAANPKKSKPTVSAAKSVPVKPAPAASVVGGDELKLVVADSASNRASSANSGSSESGAGRGDATEAELSVTLEKLDKATIENQELTGRLKDLEGQLETLQRLLTLKNDQLAGIQEQARSAELARQLQQEKQADLAAQNDVAQDAVVLEGGEENLAEEAPEVPSVELGAEESSEVVTEANDSSMTEPDASKTTSDEAFDVQNIIKLIQENPLYQALVAAGLVVLLLILWLISRRNADHEASVQAETEYGESDFIDDEQADYEADESGEFSEAEEGSDTSVSEDEFAGEEGSDPHEESADVIAEADVYIAYGRLDQAANVLEQGVSAEPIRTDYRLKLLEVYKDSNDQAAFDKQFSELEAIQDTEALDKAQEIREAFENSSEAPVEANDTIEYQPEELSSEAGQDSVESDDAGVAVAEDIEKSESAEQDEPDNSFDFESVEIDEEGLDVDLSSEDLDLDLDIELDLAQADVEAAQVEESIADAAPAEDAEAIDASVLDLDEDLSALESLATEEIDAATTDDLELELDDLDLSEELDQESEIDLPDDLSLSEALTSLDEPEPSDRAESEQAEPVSDAILEEAVEALGDADDFEPELGETEDFDFLDGADEASTKLDLARAYIDMGDIDGAKDILQEVEKEGSAEQQVEAADLIASLKG